MPSVKRKYTYPDDFYARHFNISSSSVFRYKKEGAPLDDDVKFSRWVSQRSHKPKSMRIPPKEAMRNLKREVRSRKADGADEVPENKQQKADGPRELIDGRGLRVEIARQEAECAQAYLRYREAEHGDNPMDALAFHKIWIAAQKSLRELCKDVPKSEKDDDKVLDATDVETCWLVALGQLKTMLENIPATVSLGLVNVTPEIRLQVEQSMMDEISNVITALRPAPWIK